MVTLFWKRKRSRILIFLHIICVSFFAVQSVGSQNSINPRRAKNNLTNGVLSCPNVDHKPPTECDMLCLKDEHCENRGEELKCCPAPPGSTCKAECREPVMTQNAAKNCYDYEKDRKYSIGDIFKTRDGACCQCIIGGFLNCSKTMSCTSGCYYRSKHYKDGEFFSGRRCRNCSCHDGIVRCKLKLNCTQGKEFVSFDLKVNFEGRDDAASTLTPSVLQPSDKCKYKGKIYKPDHTIRLDHGCKECVCELKGWRCTAITCNAERSSSSSNSIVRLAFLLVVTVLTYLLYS